MKLLTVNRLPELQFDTQEAINQLRVNLGFTGADVKTIMITSSVPNEGKSFVSLNLWRSMAAVGKRVLLIDGDLRLSQMRTDFGFQTSESFVGLPHVLSGQADLPDVVYRTNVPNGFILPVTNLVADPTILLSKPVFQELITACEQNFDYILIDCPPLCSVSDALVVSKYCDGSVLVVRSGFTKKHMVNESVAALKRAGSQLLGICLNRVDTSRKGSYYYSEYGGEYYAEVEKANKSSKKKK